MVFLHHPCFGRLFLTFLNRTGKWNNNNIVFIFQVCGLIRWILLFYFICCLARNYSLFRKRNISTEQKWKNIAEKWQYIKKRRYTQSLQRLLPIILMNGPLTISLSHSVEVISFWNVIVLQELMWVQFVWLMTA